MKLFGYTLSKNAEAALPDWLWTSNNRSVKAMNDFEESGSFFIGDAEDDARYIFLRGKKLCLGGGYLY